MLLLLNKGSTSTTEERKIMVESFLAWPLVNQAVLQQNSSGPNTVVWSNGVR